MSDDSMNPNVDLQIWNNNDRGGLSDTFTKTQLQGSLVDNTDSLETSSDAWVVVFNDKNYTGDSMQVGPSTYLSDLNHVTRYDAGGSSQGDWKNQIKSFVLYNDRPAFWGSVPTYAELTDPGEGRALFTDKTNFTGNNRTFSAPDTELDLHAIGYTTNSTQIYATTGGTIQSLRTGTGVWLIVFDDKECNGCAMKVEPGTTHSNLDEISRYDLSGTKQGDWKNQIASFLLYATKPAFWTTPYPRPYIDFGVLFGLFPDTTNSVSDDEIVYVVSDATYTIDQPILKAQSVTQTPPNYLVGDDTSKLPEDGWTKYYVEMSHENTGGRDDRVSFDLYFDNTGKLVSIQFFDWSSNGAYAISQTAIDIVDDEAWLLGTIGALETLGISEEVADEFVQTFDFVCKVFNDISALVYKKTDNGGSYYFLPVVCHTINRICTTILAGYGLDPYGSGDSRQGSTMSFGYASFEGALDQASDSLVTSGNWATKSGLDRSTSFNDVIEYQYNDYPFRTWYQEVSLSLELGMFVSCKIDYEIDSGDKDDHLILLVGFSVPAEGQDQPVLSFAQATIQFTDGSNDNVMTSPCFSANGDVIDAVCSQLSSSLSGVTTDSNSGGREYLADVARANLEAMVACATFGPA